MQGLGSNVLHINTTFMDGGSRETPRLKLKAGAMRGDSPYQCFDDYNDAREGAIATRSASHVNLWASDANRFWTRALELPDLLVAKYVAKGGNASVVTSLDIRSHRKQFANLEWSDVVRTAVLRKLEQRFPGCCVVEIR